MPNDVTISDMTEINQSLEWAQVQQSLEQPARKMGQYSQEMLKVSKNIGRLVSELSKEEINCRRQGKQTQRHKDMVKRINKEIAVYEQMITFGTLLGDK